MNTCTVWVLHLSRPEGFVCGPFLTEEEAVENGRGRTYEQKDVRDGWVRVSDGLVIRMDDIPTYSLRERWAYLQHQPPLKPDGKSYSEEELDKRRPCVSSIEKRLAAGMKWVGKF